MNTAKIDGYWVNTAAWIGSLDVGQAEPSMKQKYNANKIYVFLSSLGWTLNAISGILGNIQNESSINPARIQDTHISILPGAGQDITLLPNSVMTNFHSPTYSSGYALGLIQWDDSTAAGVTIVNFCDRYGYNWYSGDGQCFRLQREWETEISWIPHRIGGIDWPDWDTFVHGTATPEVMAHAFASCRVRNADPAGEDRQRNARYWYTYFRNGPVPVIPPIWLLNKRRQRVNVRIR